MKKTIVFLGVALLLANAPSLHAGRVELTTYYPSLYGEYTNLNISGRAGIGTTNPIAPLQVVGPSGGAGIIRADGPVDNSAEVVSFVGQGNSSNFQVIHEASEHFTKFRNSSVIAQPAATSGFQFTDGTDANNPVLTITNAGHMTLTSIGTEGIRSAGPATGIASFCSFIGQGLNSNFQIFHDSTNFVKFKNSSSPGGGFTFVDDTTANAAIFTIQNDGTIVGKSGTLHAPSDERLKKDIVTIDDPLGKLMKLRGVYFRWKDPASDLKGDTERKIGLIAQEVGEVIPEARHIADDKMKTQAVYADKLVALVIEAVKEQQKEIEELKKKNELFEKRLEALEAKK